MDSYFGLIVQQKKNKKYKSLARDSNGAMEVSQETTEEKLLLVIEEL
jgi:hypothetical protein